MERGNQLLKTCICINLLIRFGGLLKWKLYLNNYLKVEKEREENIFTEEDLPTGFDDDNDDGTIIWT